MLLLLTLPKHTYHSIIQCYNRIITSVKGDIKRLFGEMPVRNRIFNSKGVELEPGEEKNGSLTGTLSIPVGESRCTVTPIGNLN